MGFSLFGLKEGFASWSMVIIIVSTLLSLIMCLWLRFCYFPGGLKRSQVVDVGEFHRLDVGDVSAEEKRMQQEEWERQTGGAVGRLGGGSTLGNDSESAASVYEYDIQPQR